MTSITGLQRFVWMGLIVNTVGGWRNDKGDIDRFGQCYSKEGPETQSKTKLQLKLRFSFVLCEVKVILVHIFLKINVRLVTLHCVPREPRPTEEVLEFWANICSFLPSQLGNPMVWWRKVEPFEGMCEPVATEKCCSLATSLYWDPSQVEKSLEMQISRKFL